LPRPIFVFFLDMRKIQHIPNIKYVTLKKKEKKLRKEDY